MLALIRAIFFSNSIVIVRHSLDQVRTQVDRLQRLDADNTVARVIIASHQFVVDMSDDQPHPKCIKDAILQVKNPIHA